MSAPPASDPPPIAQHPFAIVSTILQQLNPRPSTMETTESIKQFCAKLSAYGVSRIEASYDGSGDSGDFYNICAYWLAGPTANSDGYQHEALRHFLETRAFSQPNALVTKADYETFVDDLFNLLPSGWEIDDGCYGTVIVDAASGKIEVEHSERYTEVRTETMTY